MKHRFLMHTIDLRNTAMSGGEGAIVYGEDYEREYVDFFAEVGAISLGYNHPAQQDALGRVAEEDIPIHMPQLWRHPERDRVARRICKVTKMDKVFFANCGTEAVETAVKVARKAKFEMNNRDEKKTDFTIWYYEGDYHGRTYGSLAMSDGPGYYYDGFGRLPVGFKRFKKLEDIKGDFAGIVLAPIFGNRDVIPHSAEFLTELRRIADENKAALIYDEVQSAGGRCGAWTYGEKIDVFPDILALAKGIAMGFPAAATLAKGRFAEALTPGSHFTTFGGSVIRSVFINGMIDWLTPARLKTINQNGKYLRDELRKCGFQNVRGEGLMIACDVDIDAIELTRRAESKGVLVACFRPGPGALKITPPLSITRGEIDRGLKALGEAYHEIKYQMELPFPEGEEDEDSQDRLGRTNHDGGGSFNGERATEE